MKTTTTEVICDGCGKALDVLHPTRLFITLRGPVIGHKKADFHDHLCLSRWAVALARAESNL